MARSMFRWAWVLLLCVACGDSAGGLQPGETVLTLETPALDREDVWGFLRVVTFEYDLSVAEGPFRGERLSGTFLPVARGAAEVTDGGPTDVLRARFDSAPGEYVYTVRLRDADGEVIFTQSDGRIRVAEDERTEVYRVFDPKTVDPIPVYRPLVIEVDVPAQDATDIDQVLYDITCPVPDDRFVDAVTKRSIDCSTSGSGVLARTTGFDEGGDAIVRMARFEATHRVGCGPCTLELEALNAEGGTVCSAQVEFEVEGWSFPELPPEQVRVGLSCDGGTP